MMFNITVAELQSAIDHLPDPASVAGQTYSIFLKNPDRTLLFSKVMLLSDVRDQPKRTEWVLTAQPKDSKSYGHRLPIIEDCLRALANCRLAEAQTTVLSPHHMRMSLEQLSDYTKHNLSRSLAALLVDDAEITQGVTWADEMGGVPGRHLDLQFTARTVVMTPDAYHSLCQAMRHLQTEAIEYKYSVKP